MKKYLNKLTNTIAYLQIETTTRPAFFLILYALAALQSLTTISKQSSLFYLLVSWSEPSTYLDSSIVIQAGFVFVLIFASLLLLRFFNASSKQILNNRKTMLSYFDKIIVYSEMLLGNIILIPFLRACLLQLKNESQQSSKSLAAIGLLFFLTLVCPLFLYNSITTNILIPHANKKIVTAQAQLLYNLFRIILPILSVFNQLCTWLWGLLFALIYMIAILKRPIFFYDHQTLKKGLISAVAFECLCRAFIQITTRPQLSFLIQILGLITFVISIEKLSSVRTKQILERQKPTNYQMKLLIYFAGHTDRYLPLLEHFIIGHFQKCSQPKCCCQQVVDSLTSKNEGEKKADPEACWYSFIACYMKNTFDQEEVIKLPKSEMKVRTQKYSQIIFDLTEIYLCKLQKLAQAYFTMSNFRIFLEKQGLTSLWNNRKFKIITYHLQASLQNRVKYSKTINSQANNYLNFQDEVYKLMKLIAQTSDKAKKWWDQIGKREPDEEYIRMKVTQLGSLNKNIRNQYQNIIANFEQSSKFLNPLIADYSKSVLNIFSEDHNSFLNLSSEAQQLSAIHQQSQRIDENMQAFSYDSETPMFYISVDDNSFGKIQRGNLFFKEFNSDFLGEISSIQDLIIPEMRQSHSNSMKQFLKDDRLSIENKSVFFLDNQSNIFLGKVLVQVVASLIEGFKCAIFFKKIFHKKKIVVVRNRQMIAYKSVGYRGARDLHFTDQQLMDALKKIDDQREDKIQIKDKTYYFEIIHHFNDKKHNLLFIELLSKEDQEEKGKEDQNTQSRWSSLKQLSQRKVSHVRKSHLSLINSTKSQLHQNKEQNELNERMAEVQRKLDQSIKQTYIAVTDAKIGKKMERLINIFSFSTCLVLIILLISCAIVKQNGHQFYLDTFESYVDFNKWTLAIGRIATTLKLLNLKNYQNLDSSSQYEKLRNSPNLNELMTKAMSFYNSKEVNEQWIGLNLNSNGTFTERSESYSASVIDFLQNPLANLQQYKKQNFNFSFSLDYLPKPLTPIQMQFHTYMTNAIYFALPNLRNMELYKLDPLKLSLNKMSTIEILCPLILIVAALAIFIMVLLFRKAIRLLSLSHKFVEIISQQTLLEKKKGCQKLANQYSLLLKEEKEKDASATSKLSKIKNQELTNSTQFAQKSSQMDFPVLQQRGLSKFKLTNQSVVQQGDKIEQSSQKRKKETIFVEVASLKSYCKGLLIFLLPTFPFMLFGGYFFIQQLKQVYYRQMTYTNIAGVGIVLQDITFINLYALHLGVYSYTLENYMGFVKHFATIIYEMFYVIQILLSSIQQYSNSDGAKSLQQIQYADICQLDQNGFFSVSTKSFPGRGDYAYCSSISNGALTKGFVSALLTYLQGANNLFLANIMSVMYSPEQKLNYLNSKFFTETTKLIDYFDVLLQKSEHNLREGFKTDIESNANCIVVVAVLLIVLIVLLFIVFRRYFINLMREKLEDASSVLSLISLRTIMENQKLKKLFQENLSKIKQLK